MATVMTRDDSASVGCENVKRKPEVEREKERLYEVADALEKVVIGLSDRLQPIMHDIPAGNPVSEDKVEAQVCALASDIRNVRGIYERLVARLQEVYGRLEI